MEKPFRLDGDVYRQLSIINRLELRADLTVQSLYAKAVLEYSLYHFREQHLKEKIDQALEQRDEQAFYLLAEALNDHRDRYKGGRTLYENGFRLHLTFQ